MKDKKQADIPDKPWTRKELSIRVGYVELAKAVVEQWKADGMPESELIPQWVQLIKDAQAEKNKNHNINIGG